MARWWILPFTLGTSFVLGCSRPVEHSSTTITIQAPAAYGKAGAMAAMPANRKVCYAVNVFGPGIDRSPASTCNPQMGVVAGFVESGKEISLSVPQGSDRTIELFAYLLPSGSTVDCPKVGKILTPAILLNTYKVGTAEKITIQGASQTVEMTASYPGDTNYLAATLNMPATCTTASSGSVSNPYGYHVSASMQESSATGLKLKARVGSVVPGKGPVLVGTGYKLYVK